MLIDLAIAKLLHVTLVVIWVGGMFFAYLVLRPVAGSLEPPVRLRLWDGVFHRFFPWVWAAVLLIPATGYWLGRGLYGTMANYPWHVHLMHGLGWLMVVIFLAIYFFAFQDLKAGVRREEWKAAAGALQRIRRWVGVNLTIGLIVIASASLGRFIVGW